MSEKFALNSPPAGTISTKDMTFHVQVSQSKIIEELHETSKIRISIVYLIPRNLFTAVPAYIKTFSSIIIPGNRKYESELVICALIIGRIFKELLQTGRSFFLIDDPRPRMETLALSLLNFNIVTNVILFLNNISLKELKNYNQRIYI